jgi:hypothetical protein
MVRVLLRVVILGGAGKEISLIIDGEALEMALRAGTTPHLLSFA